MHVLQGRRIDLQRSKSTLKGSGHFPSDIVLFPIPSAADELGSYLCPIWDTSQYREAFNTTPNVKRRRWTQILVVRVQWQMLPDTEKYLHQHQK